MPFIKKKNKTHKNNQQLKENSWMWAK